LTFFAKKIKKKSCPRLYGVFCSKNFLSEKISKKPTFWGTPKTPKNALF
jgi:hypothetical protein